VKGFEDLESLALRFLEIPSPIGEERALADACETWIREAGVPCIRAGDNLAFGPEARGDRPRLLLLGHLDTVPPQGENRPRLEGDRIHGLGASDMKCADALILRAVVRAATEPCRYDLQAVFYAREEGPFEESGLPEIAEAAPGFFQDVDLAIAMEPTGGAIECGCLGTLHAEVRLRGRAAHSGRPWQGENAIHKAAPLLEALSRFGIRECVFDGLRFRESCSATMIRFEGARNVIPSSCTVNLNFRFAPDRDDEEAAAFLRSFVEGVYGKEAMSGGGVSVEIADLCPAGRVCADHPLLRELEAAAGVELERRAKEAWTDVGRLSRWGIDAVNLGPGEGSQAHQAGEWCSRTRLRETAARFDAWLFGKGGRTDGV